jgi:hypothetical protein
MTRAHASLLGLTAAALLGVGSCGAPRPRNTQCREGSLQREVVTVEVDHGARVFEPPCPRHGEAFIEGPVRFSATAEGIRLQFSVSDPSFVPGPFRDPRCDRYAQGEHPSRCQRDAVVLFPSGSLPGAPFLELDTIPRAGGYAIDQLLPWTTWGLERGLGRIRFVLVIFDRGPGGEENELRLVTMVRVIDRNREGRDADGGRPQGATP